MLKGYVKDLRTAYDSCRVFVAPLLAGAGLKGKVVDALAFGVPCVMSPVAAEGMTLRDLIMLARGPRIGAYLKDVEIARLPADQRAV